MRWVEVGRGYWRSACGRFEVMCVIQGGQIEYTAAYDLERVRRFTFHRPGLSVADARRWCEERAGKAKAA